MRIIDLFEEHCGKLSFYKANVQWFWRFNDLPQTFGSDLEENRKEIYIDTGFKFDSEIELSSIISKVQIKLPKCFNENKESNKDSKYDYFVEKSFDGTKLDVLEFDILNLQNKKNFNLRNDSNNMEYHNNNKSPLKIGFKTPNKNYLTPRRSILTSRLESLNLLSRNNSKEKEEDLDNSSISNEDSSSDESNSSTNSFSSSLRQSTLKLSKKVYSSLTPSKSRKFSLKKDIRNPSKSSYKKIPRKSLRDISFVDEDQRISDPIEVIYRHFKNENFFRIKRVSMNLNYVAERRNLREYII